MGTLGNAGVRWAYEQGYRALPDGSILRPDGMPLRPYTHYRTGYQYFSAQGYKQPLSVHRFIAFHLYGEAALEAECVRHLDDDRTNNQFSNIAIGSRSQNQFDIPQLKRSRMGIERNRARRKFSAEDVRAIRALLDQGWSLKRLRKQFGGGYGIFANLRDGVTYRDVQ